MLCRVSGVDRWIWSLNVSISLFICSIISLKFVLKEVEPLVSFPIAVSTCLLFKRQLLVFRRNRFQFHRSIVIFRSHLPPIFLQNIYRNMINTNKIIFIVLFIFIAYANHFYFILWANESLSWCNAILRRYMTSRLTF